MDFIVEKAEIERREHGCDGCHYNVPTQRFDGYNDGHLWMCNTCLTELINKGISNQRIKEQ